MSRNTRFAKNGITGVAVIALVAALSSCAGPDAGPGMDKELQKASIITSFNFDAATAGYFVGVEEGFYKDAGVDLDLQMGVGSNDSLQRLITGSVDFAIADPALVINAMAKDPELDLVSVANIQQDTMYSALYIKGKNVSSIDDLAKVKFGDSGGSAATLYPTFVRNALSLPVDAPIDIVQVDPATRIGGLIKGTVDVVASVTIEAPQVEALAKESGLDAGFFDFSAHGFAPYGYAIVTQRAFAEKNPDIVRGVVEGSLLGWQWTASHLDEATTIVMPHFGATPKEIARKEVELAVHLVVAGAEEKGIGHADATRWSETADLAAAGFGIDRAGIDHESLYDVSFMPSEPVLPAGSR